jgi:L-iditol 2-dehydrogenase
VRPGPALVLGAGPVGLGALISLKHFGFGPVDVVEPQDARRGMAADLGADDATAAPLERLYPLVIEATGKDAARQEALTRVAPLGAVVQLGEADRWSIEETRPIRRKDFFLIRSFYFPKSEWKDNLTLFRAERARFERLMDATATLDGLADLFAAFARGERIKPALVFDGA